MKTQGLCSFNLIGVSVATPTLREDQLHNQLVTLRIRCHSEPEVYLDVLIVEDWVGECISRVKKGTRLYLAGKLEHTPRQKLTFDPSASSLRGVINNNGQFLILGEAFPDE